MAIFRPVRYDPSSDTNKLATVVPGFDLLGPRPTPTPMVLDARLRNPLAVAAAPTGELFLLAAADTSHYARLVQRWGLTGDHFDAQEALRIGMVNEVVPHDELMDRTRALAKRIAFMNATSFSMSWRRLRIHSPSSGRPRVIITVSSERTSDSTNGW